MLAVVDLEALGVAGEPVGEGVGVAPGGAGEGEEGGAVGEGNSGGEGGEVVVFGVDVDEDFVEVEVGVVQGGADGVGDAVAFGDAEAGGDAGVEVAEDVAAHAAGAQLVDAEDAGYGAGSGFKALEFARGEAGVNEFAECTPRDFDAHAEDEEADEGGTEGFEEVDAEEAAGDADGDDEGGGGVGAGVPGVGDEDGGVETFAGAQGVAEEGFFGEEGKESHAEGGRVEGGAGVGGDLQAFTGDPEEAYANGDEEEAEEEAGGSFDAAVTVGMAGVGGTGGTAGGDEDDEVGEEVSKGVAGVGDEAEGVGVETNGDLEEGEGEVGGE